MAAPAGDGVAAVKGWRGIGRLASRHAMLAAWLGVMMGAVFSVLQIGDEYRRSVDAERDAILQMMAVMREPAAQAGYNLNEQAARVVVQGALSFTPVQQATLTSDFGEVLAEGTNASVAAGADAWWTRFIAPTQVHTLPLEFGPARRRVGELKVVTAQAPRVERFLRDAWRDAGLNVLRSVTVALALGVLSYLTLTRPLTAIARRIAHGPAASGRGEPMPEAGRRDEIGQIAVAFEHYERDADDRARSLEASAQALAASEVRYRRIVETAGEGVWQLDDQGCTLLANEAMARMLGTTPQALVGRSLFEFVDPADRDEVQTLLHGHPCGDGSRPEIRFRRIDGEEVWTEVSTCPIADAEGRLSGTLAMVTNSTERRGRDAQLHATNAQLTSMVADLERHKSDMAQIGELNELLQSARTEAEAFDAIRAAAAHLFADSSGGFSVTGKDDEMVVVGTWGDTHGLPATYDRGTCWAIRRGGRHLHSAQRGICCGHRPGDQRGTMVCTPLYMDGELVGVLHLHLAQVDSAALEESLRQRTDVFGEVVKLGLSNLRLRETLREQALRDALTGLPNRRLFDETLPRELLRCLRADQPLTVAVVDVDHFKQINDTYGHETGDRMLRLVGDVLTRSIRASDMACRYGGDEFMCLLPGMDAQDARLRFEQALRQLAAQAGPPALPGAALTFTVGLATAPGCGADAASLVSAADAALYVAKEKGRNCVHVAAAAPAPPPRRFAHSLLG